MLEHASPLVKVTIIPRGRALGAAWYLPEERQLTTREQILDEMAYALGGRAAEKLIFGKISTGEKVGNISFYDSSGQGDFGFTKPYSEKTAELIDREVKDIIEESYERAVDVLKIHIKGLTELAELLLEKEVIFGEDLERIFGKRKADLIKDAELAAQEKQSNTIAETNVEKNDSQTTEQKLKNEKESDSSEKANEDLKKPLKKPKVEE